MSLRMCYETRNVWRIYLLSFILMNFGNLLFKHQEDDRKLIRNIESLSKKITNAKLSVLFN